METLLAVTSSGLVRIEIGADSEEHGVRHDSGLGAGDGDGLSDGAVRLSVLLPDDDLRAVAFDSREPSTCFAGSRASGLHRSLDGGDTWHAVGAFDGDVFALSIGPADGSVWVGTEPSRLFRSRDRGETWSELDALQDIPSRSEWSFPPRPWTSHVRSIAPHPADTELVLVGIELGGIMRTTDGGRTFHDHPEGAVKDVHALAWHPIDHDRAYEAGGGGAAFSMDRGASWQRLAAGRDRSYCWGLAVDPEEPNRWYVSAAAGAGRAHRDESSDAAVFRSEGGGSWERIGVGLPDPLHAFPYALAATVDHVWVGLADGRIFRSADRGERFDQIETAGDDSVLAGLRHLVPWT